MRVDNGYIIALAVKLRGNKLSGIVYSARISRYRDMNYTVILAESAVCILKVGRVNCAVVGISTQLLTSS